MAKDFLKELSNNETIKSEGESPFAKKNQSKKTVKISEDNYEELRLLAFNNRTTIFNEMESMIKDAKKYREQNKDKK